MDNGEPFGGEGSPVQVYQCHALSDPQVNQKWKFTEEGLIVAQQEGNRCVGVDSDGFLRLHSTCDQKFSLKAGNLVHTATGKCVTVINPGPVIELPQLNIIKGGIYSQGGSSGGDMAIQFHIAFSKHVTGVCGNDAQPYHCAVTRFPGDYLLPQTEESSVPHCYGCPDGMTVLYDKCKNHPQHVDVGMLPDYPRRVCGDGGKPGCIDDAANIYDDYVYLSRGECRTYIGGAEVNTLAMYGMMTTDPETQLKYIDKCATEEGVDDDKECITHVMGPKVKINPPAATASSRVRVFNMMPFIADYNLGFESTAFAYIPGACYNTTTACRALVHFHGCGGNNGPDQDARIHLWAETNNLVVLYPRIKKNNNVTRTYPNSYEIARGCWDGYGQLSDSYALQNGEHMATVWRMVARLAGLEDAYKQ